MTFQPGALGGASLSWPSPSRRELVRTWVATASRWAGLCDRGLASSYLAGVRLALDFGSWSFAHPHETDDADIVKLMVILVEAAMRRR